MNNLSIISGIITYERRNERKAVTCLIINGKTQCYYFGLFESELFGASVKLIGAYKNDRFMIKSIDVLDISNAAKREKIYQRICKNKNATFAMQTTAAKDMLINLYIMGKKALIKKILTYPIEKQMSILENPLRLYLDKELDFYSADMLSMKHPNVDHKQRIYPCSLHLMREFYNSKCEFVEIDRLIAMLEGRVLCELNKDIVAETLKKGDLHVDKDGKVWLKSIYWLRERVCELMSKNIAMPTAAKSNVETELNKLLSHKWVVLTGGAGTGKTTLIRKVKGIYKDVLFTATTGKASKVLDEEARTIHSILGFGRKGYSVKKLKCDLLVVDEASMLDWRTLYAILRAAPRVIFVGDPNQLPPVKGEPVFRKMIEMLPVVKLTTVHRFASSGNNTDTAVEIIKRNDKSSMCSTVGAIASMLSRQKRTYQVITPLVYIAQQLNVQLQKELNPAAKTAGRKYTIGDKVIINKNIYSDGIFVAGNGQIGKIVGYADSDYCVYIDKNVILREDEIDLAYALTVHKSQGSEYDYVIFVVPPDVREDFMTNELLTVGKTRGKIKTYMITY